MVLIILSILFFLVIIGSLIIPKISKYLLEREKEQFLTQIEQDGSLEERERVRLIKGRERDINLKLIEHEQAVRILEVPSVRNKLESVNIDVEELKNLLRSEKDDEVVRQYKLLTFGKEKE